MNPTKKLVQKVLPITTSPKHNSALYINDGSRALLDCHCWRLVGRVAVNAQDSMSRFYAMVMVLEEH